MRVPQASLPAAAASAALLLAADGAAQTTAYARQLVTNIGASSGVAGNLQVVGGTTTVSRSSASLTSSRLGRQRRVDALDAPMSCRGFGCVGLSENNFSLNPPQLAKGDALIAADLMAARNDALVNLIGPDVGAASGSNALEATVRLAAIDRLFFRFTDSPFLVATVAADATPQSRATARLSFELSVSSLGGGGVVFSWRPDGQPGGVGGPVGGVETADPTSLNESLVQTGPGARPNYVPGAMGFAANTNLLVPGDYSIQIDMDESVDADYAVAPEPTSLVLLGSGALGLAAVARPRRRGAR